MSPRRPRIGMATAWASGGAVMGTVGGGERKRREPRRALIDAAQRLAGERGPDQVTVEEIADAADVSVRTFFNYFQAKEDAMVGMDPAMLDAVGAAVLERP